MTLEPMSAEQVAAQLKQLQTNLINALEPKIKGYKKLINLRGINGNQQLRELTRPIVRKGYTKEALDFIDFIENSLLQFETAILDGNGVRTARNLKEEAETRLIKLNNDEKKINYQAVITDLTDFINGVVNLQNSAQRQKENSTFNRNTNYNNPSNRGNNREFSIFHDAAKEGNHEILSQLINNPIYSSSLNTVDSNYETPLLLALKANQFGTASMLCFHKEVDLRKSNSKGEAPIHVIAQFSVKDIESNDQRKKKEKEIISFMEVLFYRLETCEEKQELLSSTHKSPFPRHSREGGNPD